MPPLLLLLLIVLHLVVPCVCGATLPATSGRWQGRTLQNNPVVGSVSFAWEGTQVSVITSGATTLCLVSSTSLPQTSSFHALVNGVVMTNFTLAPSTPSQPAPPGPTAPPCPHPGSIRPQAATGLSWMPMPQARRRTPDACDWSPPRRYPVSPATCRSASAAP